ncbi:MAG: cytochrome b [Rickettsiaceae bacterium H1]|nr:cytochrome b [Rickettsiaceae bacterium H1]
MVKKYNLFLRFMHWFMAMLIIGLIIVGFNMGKADDAIKPFIYGIHKAIGVTIIGLVLLRLLIRIFTVIPPMPNNFLLDYIARIVHWCLYLLMFSMPISGYIMSSSSGRNFTWFFDINVPLLIEKNQKLAVSAHTLHVVGAYVFVVFISLHFLGTLKHLIIDKENILKRIW